MKHEGLQKGPQRLSIYHLREHNKSFGGNHLLINIPPGPGEILKSDHRTQVDFFTCIILRISNMGG